MNHYRIYIKSHCEMPDYENDGEAESKEKFAEDLVKHQGLIEWSIDALLPYIEQI